MGTIAVTGGKGGTGKSTVAILMAFQKIAAGQKVLLVDCDVECPNDRILLGIDDLGAPAEKTYTFYPEIIEDKCQKCGLCVEKCKSGALFQTPGNVPTLKKDLCSSCGVCWNVCPHGAIKKVKEENGEIFRHDIDENLTLVTGQSIPGVRETSPVVRQTRKYISGFEKDFDFVIIDTAAGSHCTVMSALENVDEAFAVTEPTPLGAHDLNVILKVLKVLDVDSNVVLNRSDVGDKSLVSEIADANETKVVAEVPYDKTLAEAYSEGRFWESRSELVKLLEL